MSKILLVEDDATMRSLLKTLLELDNHQVTLIGNPDQNIIQSLIDTQPDVLIMDVNLRHSNGIEILKTIRSSEIPWRLYILMTSGMDFQDECLKAGADGFLLKPYMPEDLNRQLKKVQEM
jgi:two-component system nitrate/nitrite response regulator NarP